MTDSCLFRTKLLTLLLSLCMGGTSCFAICDGGGVGNGGVVPSFKPTETFRVSWKSLPPGKQLPINDPTVSLIILWFPVSLSRSTTSSLQGSAELTALGARGVVNSLVTPGNADIRKTYTIPANQEVLVITARDGAEIGRVAAEPARPLSAEQVEDLVRTLLKDRATEIEARLPEHAGPPLSSAELQAVRAALEAGVKAETEVRYAEAEKHYVDAVTLAPNDATSLRFLGEFCRHHTGQWNRAGQLFNHIIDHPSDPIAHAVALHGLGAMEIHAGHIQEGLVLMEKSIEVYPLPITYRSLAAYWLSEKRTEKASGYMQQALILDADDPYNQIFAAVHLAASGYISQALRIARANEHALEASYNLATIWAQAGDRAKALELLQRQFYTYAQYDATRAMQMKDAREDPLLASLHADPSFIELTKDAKTAWMTGRDFCSSEELRPFTTAPGPNM